MTGGKLDLLSKWLEKIKQLGNLVSNLSFLLPFITFPVIYLMPYFFFFFAFQHLQKNVTLVKFLGVIKNNPERTTCLLAI